MAWFPRRRRKAADPPAVRPAASPVTTFPTLAESWVTGDGRLLTPDPGIPLVEYAADPWDVWRSQPSVRKVVDFIARNVSTIPLHLYRRVSDTDRVRVTDHPLATLLRQPGDLRTPHRLWHSLLVDYLLYDRWCARVLPSADTVAGWELLRVPAPRMRLATDMYGRVTRVHVYELDGSWTVAAPRGFVFDHGYAAEGANGTAPIVTLANILRESSEAVQYRRDVWRNGARVPAVIERPSDAPPWDDKSRGRFAASWRNFIRGGGAEGGTPVLEDGMRLSKVDAFTPRDTDDLEGRKLTDAEVAAAYHIAPELVGAREGTYSNIDAYRQMLYRDELGPLITAIEQTVNAMLVPLLVDDPALYVEANMEAKLRGSFEEQARVMQAAVGAPWLTRNEARSRTNLPAVDGGEELVTPLNVVTGGLASPRDTAPDSAEQATPPKTAAKAMKARPDDGADRGRETHLLATVLARHLRADNARLHASLSAGAALIDAWGDPTDRDQTLADVIAGPQFRAAQAGAWDVLDRWNPTGDGWDDEGMRPWLVKAAASHARRLNRAAYDRLAAAADDPDDGHTDALEHRVTTADEVAASIAAEAYGFASVDAARAVGLTRKTWRAAPDARAEHRDLDAATVAVDEPFPGGARWPGDISAGTSAYACRCTLTFGR